MVSHHLDVVLSVLSAVFQIDTLLSGFGNLLQGKLKNEWCWRTAHLFKLSVGVLKMRKKLLHSSED